MHLSLPHLASGKALHCMIKPGSFLWEALLGPRSAGPVQVRPGSQSTHRIVRTSLLVYFKPLNFGLVYYMAKTN